MPVIFVTSSKKEVGKTTVLSGISYESIKRGLKTFVGEFNQDQIVEHSNFYNLMDSKEIKCDFNNSDLALIEINNASIDSIKRLSSKYLILITYFILIAPNGPEFNTFLGWKYCVNNLNTN